MGVDVTKKGWHEVSLHWDFIIATLSMIIVERAGNGKLGVWWIISVILWVTTMFRGYYVDIHQ